MPAKVDQVRVMRMLLLAATGWVGVAHAGDPKDREAWVWAASCMACHGSQGDAAGVSFRLKGLEAPALYEKLLAFRRGTVQSTVMKQFVAGYSEDELRRIASAFAEIGANR